MPSDLKEGGTGIGWRDRHWQPRERGGARGGPRARRPVGPSTAPSPPARTAAAGSLPLPSRRHCLCTSLFHPGVAAGPGWTSQPGVQRLCGAPSARQCPLGEPQGELHQEGLRGAGRAEPWASRGRLGGLGSLSGAGRRSCEVVPVRRARQMARAGTSRPSGVGVLTAGLSAALTVLPRWDGAFSRARCPPAPPRLRRAAPGCGSGRPLVFLRERRSCRLVLLPDPFQVDGVCFSFRAQR